MMFTLSVKERQLTAQDTGTGEDFPQAVKRVRSAGFTLIELMIVVSIIGILASISVPNYQRGVIRAREAVLMDTLHTFRKAIDEFYADNGKYPDVLDDLSAKGYLRGVPTDPFTKKKDTWIPVAPAEVPSTEGSEEQVVSSAGASAIVEAGSIYDVHSGSNLIGLNGVPYNEW